MRTERGRAPAVALLLLFAGCAAKPPVHVEHDQLADFSRYHTYAWVAAPREPTPYDPDPSRGLIDWRLHLAVDTQLGAHGLAQLAPPDLLVRIHSTIEEKEIEQIGGYAHYRDAGGTKPLFDTFSFGYDEAVLTVELFDAATQQMVWRGVGGVAMDAKDRNGRIAATVAQMFAVFPPQEE